MPVIEITTLVFVVLPYAYATLDIFSCGYLSKQMWRSSETYAKLNEIEGKLDDIGKCVGFRSVMPYNL